MNNWWMRGFTFAGGAIGAVGMWMLINTGFQSFASKNDTDSEEARSQMALRVDHGTGCQYLESSRGSLAPRMGRDGKQVCKGGV